jgi:hypothetical protein
MNLSDKIDAAIGGVHNLPTLPGVAMKLLQTVDSADFCLRDIAEIISTDPPLSAKVLSLINSPFYGMKSTAPNPFSRHSIFRLNPTKTILTCWTLHAGDCRAACDCKKK